MLAATDEAAFTAILAHEDAHLRNKDTNGSLNLAEFYNCFEFIFHYAPPDSTVSGALFYWLLDPLSKTLAREEIRLSRCAEIEADRHAARSGDTYEAARALVLLGAASLLIKERVYASLKRELLGAMTPPEPPLARSLKATLELSRTDVLSTYAQMAWDEPDDETSDHPPWSERLKALGYDAAPQIEAVQLTALSTVLPVDMVSERIRHFDDAWTAETANNLER